MLSAWFRVTGAPSKLIQHCCHTHTLTSYKLSPRLQWQFNSRRIYVRPRTGPQSTHLWWPASCRQPACLGSCAMQPVCYSLGWNRQTDGRIAVLLDASLRGGRDNSAWVQETGSGEQTWMLMSASNSQLLSRFSASCTQQRVLHESHKQLWLLLSIITDGHLHIWLGGRKGIRPVKNWVVGCWRGYLSGARCRLAYGPADATATHCLFLQ